MAVGTALCSILSVLSSFKSSTPLANRSYSTYDKKTSGKNKKLYNYYFSLKLTIVLSLDMESSLGALESSFTPNIKSVSKIIFMW